MAERDAGSQNKLFRTEVVPGTAGSGRLFDEQPMMPEPVECLGMTFASDAARRAYFMERLRELLPELRKRPDFPAGDDDAILRLSDPPWYTACPNPFLADFAAHYGRPYATGEPYHREPFAVDVSEGKTDPLYRAHGYHTKVPHRAIVPSILHYTKPGDLVLDGFCGSGMTGVAAQWCGTAPAEYRERIERQWQAEGRPAPEWGARRALLGDLSPAATFIAANYNTPFDAAAFAKAARQLLDEVEAEIGWMYETLHTDGRTKGRINYTVWSEVFSCPECAGEVVFLDAALAGDRRTRPEFPCPHCSAKLTKRSLERSFETFVDHVAGDTWSRIRLRPVAINYAVGTSTHEKVPDAADLAMLDRVTSLRRPLEVPVNAFAIDEMYHGSRLAPKGFTHVHRMFLPRPAHALAAMWRCAQEFDEPRLRNMLLFFVEQAIWTLSVLNRFRANQGSQSNQVLSGVYYVPSQIAEISPWYRLRSKVSQMLKSFQPASSLAQGVSVTTGSCEALTVPANSIDYVFTDPPFGENIYYADLNYLVESWHRVLTASRLEAIIDRAKGKTITDYQHLMQRCFAEYCRVLKPGRWMTVVFHNSRNAVWNAIQEAMLAAGFVVADVRTLDKRQGSYRQVTSTAVKQDLVISAYKPNNGLEARFRLQSGTEDGVWDFVRTHLRQLPVFVAREDRAEVIAERQSHLLFDRMVAFHVQRGVLVPLSAAEFAGGLAQRFAERDGMFFLTEQVAEYDRRRMKTKELRQLTIFVDDEDSAIQWLRQSLAAKPQTFQEVHPHFIRELGGWRKHELMPELSALLAQNFLRYDGMGEVPSQIHGYLSSNFKELRGLEKDAVELRYKAKDRWYVPDPRKAGDLEKLRERTLLKEFDEYRESAQRTLKVFRLEAVRAGFKRAWQTRDYGVIVAVAGKVPDAVLHEDPKLLMWYDQALTRTGADR